jgi:hypothetical protein
MKKFDIEFEVTQKFIHYTTVEAETPEQALEKFKEMEEYESEEDYMLEGWDEKRTAEVVGERVDGPNNTSHRIPVKL